VEGISAQTRPTSFLPEENPLLGKNISLERKEGLEIKTFPGENREVQPATGKGIYPDRE